jgi:rod shape-determining protein MreC
LRVFLWLTVSSALMVGDYRFAYFSTIKSLSSIAVTPIQYSVNIPSKTFRWLADYLVSHHHLMDENTKLQEQQLLLEAQIQQLSSLENENSQLRELLNASKSSPYSSNRVLVAQILTINSNPFDQEIVLDKGKNDGIYIGQPVVDSRGLIGQIVAANPISSRALLVTSTNSAIPVEDTRNGTRAIAIGSGAIDTLSLIYVPNTADIQIGDVFTTSGLGMKFPKGYAVGQVISIEHPANERFAVIKLLPSAKFNMLNQILLIWPKQAPINPARVP